MEKHTGKPHCAASETSAKAQHLPPLVTRNMVALVFYISSPHCLKTDY